MNKTIDFCYFWMLLIVFIVSAPMTPAPAAWASTFYAATNGNGTSCTIESPCPLNTGLGKLAAGDTLYLRGGTYHQTVSAGNSGSASAPITISGYPGETAITRTPIGNRSLASGGKERLMASACSNSSGEG